MLRNNILIVYNTCGLSGKENADHYLGRINNLLNQDLDDFRVVVSDCCSSKQTSDKLPLCITMNSTVINSIKHFGEFDAYLYVDSGVDIKNKKDVKELWQLLRSDPTYGLVAAQTDDDNGYSWWGINPKQLIIPVGKTVNLHCQLYSNEYFKAYGKLLPDIFAADSHESIYTFLTAAIGLQFVLHPDIVVNHVTAIDGPSSGFGRGNHLFLSPKTIKQICDEGHPLGFGYEEFANVCVHDQNLYKNNVFLHNPKPLYEFLLNNVFLSKAIFDYDKINLKFNK